MLNYFSNMLMHGGIQNKENAVPNNRCQTEKGRKGEAAKWLESCLSISSAPLVSKTASPAVPATRCPAGDVPHQIYLPHLPQKAPLVIPEAAGHSAAVLNELCMDIEKICLETAVQTESPVTNVVADAMMTLPVKELEEKDEKAIEGFDPICTQEGMEKDEKEEEKDDKNEEEGASLNELAAGFASLGVGEDEKKEATEEEGEDDEDMMNSSLYRELDDTPPISIADARKRIRNSLGTVSKSGLPVINMKCIKFGKLLGEGAFGTVKAAEVVMNGKTQECAVKTILLKGKEFNNRLAAFQTEAQVSWLATEAARKMPEGRRSRVCQTLAISYQLMRVPRKLKGKVGNKSEKTEEADEGDEEAEEHEKVVEEGDDVEAAELVLSSLDSEKAAASQTANEEEGSKKEGGGGRWKIKGKMHLIMEKVNSRGDLHKQITASHWWEGIRSNGEDTGAKLRCNYTMTDDDGDLFAYTMPRRLKLAFAEELARGMIELRRSNIVHCDIKPCNVLLVTVPQKHKAALKESAKKVARSARSAISGSGKQSEETEDTEAPTETEAEAAVLPALKIADFGLKIIDFGEGNTPEKAAGFIAGTPGYQAKEVVDDGECSFASDIYAVGVSLVEVWAGEMWAGAETRGEGYPGMRKEMLEALSKIDRADPKVARLLRRCVSENVKNRPTALQLLRAIRILRAEAAPIAQIVQKKGRSWALHRK